MDVSRLPETEPICRPCSPCFPEDGIREGAPTAAEDCESACRGYPGSMSSEARQSPSAPASRHSRIRRAPKFVPFMAIGGILALITAGVTTFTGPPNPDYSQTTVLGFMSVFMLPFGLLAGALVALLLDWISVKRARDVD